ncbi:MAG: hypothetical protein U5L03_10080 [Burkholderiaceae bacterium]|nr:hypothetical protein [Burkholderiaceae bacterium]
MKNAADSFLDRLRRYAATISRIKSKIANREPKSPPPVWESQLPTDKQRGNDGQ